MCIFARQYQKMAQHECEFVLGFVFTKNLKVALCLLLWARVKLPRHGDLARAEAGCLEVRSTMIHAHPNCQHDQHDLGR
jgi:hypothetical protein